MKLTISLAQLEFEFGEVEANFEHAEEWVVEAAGRGSDIILLPELWSSGYDLENWSRYATSLDDGIFRRISTLARDYQISIGGSLLEAKDGCAYNTFVLYGSDGETWGVYRKIHRFRLLQEEKWLKAGDQLVMAQTPWGGIGLSICYDLRFPEMFRPYFEAGARLIFVVAEWPERRVDHWTKLLQARAIENQSFFAGVNKVGYSQAEKLGGCSTVVNPWGNPLVEGNDEEALLTTEIDLLESDNARQHIPVLKDRNIEIYSKRVKDD